MSKPLDSLLRPMSSRRRGDEWYCLGFSRYDGQSGGAIKSGRFGTSGWCGAYEIFVTALCEYVYTLFTRERSDISLQEKNWVRVWFLKELAPTMVPDTVAWVLRLGEEGR